jgi:hypothetical protein
METKIKKEDIMNWLPIFAVILIAATSTQGLEPADAAHTTFNYDMYAHGDDVGDMQIQIIENKEGGYQIFESKTIKKSSISDKADLKSTANELYSQESRLISGDKKTFDQNIAYWSRIDSFGDDFWMSHSEMKNFAQKEESELVGFSIAILDNLIPEAGLAVGLSQLLTPDTKALPKSVRFPKTSHHTTLANLPKYWLINQKKLPAKINLLDIETTSITEMKTEYIGLDVRIYNGNEVPTNHYTLSSQSLAPINIWLAVNDDNTPYCFELKIENNNGLFTITRTLR